MGVGTRKCTSASGAAQSCSDSCRSRHVVRALVTMIRASPRLGNAGLPAQYLCARDFAPLLGAPDEPTPLTCAVLTARSTRGFYVPPSNRTALAQRAQPLCGALLFAALSACGGSEMPARPALGKPSVEAGSTGAAAGSGNGQAQAGTGNPDAPVLIAGGSGGQSAPAPNDPMDTDADCGKVTQMAEGKLAPADIVWIIDGSASMVDEILAVQANITKFASTISTAGVDHHVVMLAPADAAAGTPLSMDAARYRWVLAPVDSNNPLSLLLLQYPDYSAFLRPEAALHFIVVSDDDSHMAADEFRAQMGQLVNKPFFFHAIASEDVNGLGCIGACGLPIVCGAFAPGRQYYALADATGGQKISICTADWSQVFEPLQKAVIEAAPLPCEYDIPTPPSGSTLDPSRVNIEVVTPSAAPRTLPRTAGKEACGSEVAWYYDDPKTPSRISMCPSACEAISGGGSVQIKLGCETVSLD